MSKGSNQSRPRGILTPTDREFLLGKKKEYSQQQCRDRRQAIRERIYHSILDFGIIWMYLGSRDIKQIFNFKSGKKLSIIKAIQDMIAFMILGLDNMNDNKSIRIGAAILQASTAGCEFPIEFKLNYSSQSSSEQLGWENKYKNKDNTTDKSNPIIENIFFNMFQPSHNIIDPDIHFEDISYMAREKLLLSDIDADILADYIYESELSKKLDKGEISIDDLATQISKERELMSNLPVKRPALSYPVNIENGKVIWASELEEYSN